METKIIGSKNQQARHALAISERKALCERAWDLAIRAHTALVSHDIKSARALEYAAQRTLAEEK